MNKAVGSVIITCVLLKQGYFLNEAGSVCKSVFHSTRVSQLASYVHCFDVNSDSSSTF